MGNMKFYHAEYKRQKYEGANVWRDVGFFTSRSIIVLAENYPEASQKIIDCLQKNTNGEYRAVLDSNIQECIGIDIEHGFDETRITPFVKE